MTQFSCTELTYAIFVYRVPQFDTLFIRPLPHEFERNVFPEPVMTGPMGVQPRLLQNLKCLLPYGTGFSVATQVKLEKLLCKPNRFFPLATLLTYELLSTRNA
jgi:hypothetical protein